MAMDWVPCNAYGTSIVVPNGEQFDVPMLSIDTWSSAQEVIGNIEETTKAYKVLRMVGYWTVCFDVQEPEPPALGEVALRMWPGFQQQAGGAGAPGVFVPGWLLNAGGISAQDVARVANEKFWWERLLGGPYIEYDSLSPWALATDPYNHPWMFTLDIKPRQWVGEGETVVWSIHNETNLPLEFRHRFRMLVAH